MIGRWGSLFHMGRRKSGDAPEGNGPVRLTIVQYGDYAEAAARFLAGEEESYYAQRFTVEFLAELVRLEKTEQITVISFAADTPEAVTASGVRTVGIELYPKKHPARIGDLLDKIAASRPTHLVVAAPIFPAIRWGLHQNVPVLPLFADSFRAGGVKAYIRNRQLAHLLNHPAIKVVANHSLAASLDLARIGVDSDKIVPFDWPELISDQDYPPKPAPSPDRPFRMLYVGQLTEAKGVGDAIRALSILHGRGRQAVLTLIGGGETSSFAELARQNMVERHVVFAGRLPHSRVLAEMRAHDVVLVPSHHAYPEGLPMTLFEALCVRTPLVVSDHPMFALRIHDGKEALVHPERDPAAMADQVQRLARDPRLYERLSSRVETMLQDYLCPLKWDRLLEDFLDPDARERLRRFSLARQPFLGRSGGKAAQ